MLMLIAYDIRSQRRLAKVAKHCEDYGVRVQYSVFECRLEADIFDEFWQGINSIINEEEDRVVAYRICTQCAKNIHTAGEMVSNEKVVAYVFREMANGSCSWRQGNENGHVFKGQKVSAGRQSLGLKSRGCRPEGGNPLATSVFGVSSACDLATGREVGTLNFGIAARKRRKRLDSQAIPSRECRNP